MMFMRAMGLFALPTCAKLRQSSVSARKAFRQNSCRAVRTDTLRCERLGIAVAVYACLCTACAVVYPESSHKSHGLLALEDAGGLESRDRGNMLWRKDVTAASSCVAGLILADVREDTVFSLQRRCHEKRFSTEGFVKGKGKEPDAIPDSGLGAPPYSSQAFKYVNCGLTVAIRVTGLSTRLACPSKPADEPYV